jgi:hypothetical protein
LLPAKALNTCGELASATDRGHGVEASGIERPGISPKLIPRPRGSKTVPKGHFQDPWNPTADEVRAWAYDANATHEQDWELAVIRSGYDELLIELAADLSCPKAGFFLACLYLLVGDSVRSKGGSQSGLDLPALFERAESTADPELRLWVVRSRDLIRSPEKFDYDRWCCGGILLEGMEDDIENGFGDPSQRDS